MNNRMLSTENVFFSYSNGESEKIVLKDVNVTINKGEFVVILGHNGSGKSTLAKHFNGILIPKDGNVFVDSYNTRNEEDIWNIRQNAGMVFQNPDNQIVATIVEEDVAFGPENLGVSPDEIRQRVDDALNTVNMLEYKEHGPHLLSGGQKQRVAIAGVLAMKPSCIILDEPTAMLDPSGRAEVISTIKKLNAEEGITIVLITHYMEEAAQADRIIVMDAGEPIIDGTPREVFKEVRRLKEIGLDVPQVTELAYRLRQSGVDLKEDILTIEEMVDEICRLK
ncbi:MAG: energy-coupling factor transporter ATPase [Clostridium sp.]|uniref:energy-coupling factor transporter ATPase n=1 Tax=Clostridium sp. TaxID=1506 RepID=UPI002FCC1B96